MIEINGDRYVSAQSPADRDRDRIGKPAVDQPLIADPSRTEYPRKCDRRPDCFLDGSRWEPYLAAGYQIGGDRCIQLGISFDRLSNSSRRRNSTTRLPLISPPLESRTSSNPTTSRQ